MTRAKRRASWARQIREQSNSGLNIAEWCRQKSINDKTFRRWKRILTIEESKTPAAAAPTGWCQVQPKIAAEKPASLKLVVNNQITIELEPGFNPKLLREVLAVLCP